MKTNSFAHMSLLCGLGLALAACSGTSSVAMRMPVVDEVVPPEMLLQVFGAEGVETTNASERRLYVNSLDRSSLSSADYQTTNTPVRLLKVRLAEKPQGFDQARQEYQALKREFENLRGLEEIPGVQVGDEAAAFQTDLGRNFRLVARKGTKVTSLHVRGSDLPADSLQALQRLAQHILDEAEKRSPSPAS